MRVKCANCGTIFNKESYMDETYCYPKNYRIMDRCPKCGSNAYGPLDATDIEKIHSMPSKLEGEA